MESTSWTSTLCYGEIIVGHLHGDRLDGLTGGHRSAAVDHLHLVEQPGKINVVYIFEKPGNNLTFLHNNTD